MQLLASVSDGALPNRTFYRMHDEQMSNTDDSSVVYRSINLYTPGRYIWFFADPPHFMKTTRKMYTSFRYEHLFNKSNKMTTK